MRPEASRTSYPSITHPLSSFLVGRAQVGGLWSLEAVWAHSEPFKWSDFFLWEGLETTVIFFLIDSANCKSIELIGTLAGFVLLAGDCGPEGSQRDK